MIRRNVLIRRNVVVRRNGVVCFEDATYLLIYGSTGTERFMLATPAELQLQSKTAWRSLSLYRRGFVSTQQLSKVIVMCVDE